MEQNQPTPTPTETPVVAPQVKKMSGRTKAALWCLIAPTALIVVTAILYSIVNTLFPVTLINETGFTTTASPLQSIINVLLFAAGSIGALAWLPGVITGIVLLATNKPATPPQA